MTITFLIIALTLIAAFALMIPLSSKWRRARGWDNEQPYRRPDGAPLYGLPGTEKGREEK